MDIQIGKYEVLDHGLLIGVPGERIKFILAKDLSVSFEFIDSGMLPSNNIEARAISSTELLISIGNYKNWQVHGNIEPIEIGYFRSRRLYLNYRIGEHIPNRNPMSPYLHHGFEPGGVTLYYTWLLGDKK